MVRHEGGCHCGRVRFEVRAPAVLSVFQCNCSVCSKSGYIALIVPKERFVPTRGAESLTGYRFNTRTASHLLCAVCGIKSVYRPGSHPDGVGVKARCLDPGTVEAMIVKGFAGRNWEKQYPPGRARGYPE